MISGFQPHGIAIFVCSTGPCSSLIPPEWHSPGEGHFNPIASEFDLPRGRAILTVYPVRLFV